MEEDRPATYCTLNPARSSSVSSDPGLSPREPIFWSGSDSSRGGNQAGWKRVVVVGGGIAGSLLAKSLQFHADVVLIDQKEYFEIPWATMRSMVDHSVAEKAIINHKDYLVNGKLITSAAVDITETEVVTADGRRVTYDYLVVATGHSSPSPTCRKERLEMFQEANIKMRIASSILIIGGGPTGVELASDITAVYPDKKVTLVHSGPRLLGFIGHKAGNKALEWLRSKNVDVLLEQYVDLESMPPANGIYMTSAGEAIAADLHFLCVKRPLGSSWLKQTSLKDCLDKYGQVMVDEHLKLIGRKNVFAIGDITDIPERKQGVVAQRHSMVVAKNLKALLKGGKEVKLGKYRPSMSITMVSLGKKDAVAQLPFTTMSGFLPGLIKSRELFLRKTRKALGLENHGFL
ncbi:apoptosis-inducing factor [Canna indica]|uniref:Apoptosis-inducing factor n=1 Tax=Canna indica TaxID=4628 RepID=A0AAQ3K7G4_9LILI|nr:apoptosis-inducing factor [Canna indica]